MSFYGFESQFKNTFYESQFNDQLNFPKIGSQFDSPPLLMCISAGTVLMYIFKINRYVWLGHSHK